MTSERARWRPMTGADMAEIGGIASHVHSAFPEDEAIFRERLRLHPAGCHVLATSAAIVGYCISHPWRQRRPPALNTLLGTLPADADTYYIHDVALLSEARGSGAGTMIADELARHARALSLPQISLIAVYDAARFWARHGFAVVHDPDLTAKLRTYDEAARYMERPLDQ